MKETTYALLNVSVPIAVREIPLTDYQKVSIRRFRRIGRDPVPNPKPHR
jgi:hypothetical protein